MHFEMCGPKMTLQAVGDAIWLADSNLDVVFVIFKESGFCVNKVRNDVSKKAIWRSDLGKSSILQSMNGRKFCKWFCEITLQNIFPIILQNKSKN